MIETIKNLVVTTAKNAGEHDISLHGAAIAFYAIFSTAPLVVIALFVLGIFMNQQQTAEVVTHYLEQLINPNVANVLLTMAETSSVKSTGLVTSIIAAGILLFGATTVITQLRSTLNHIWGVRRIEESSVRLYLWNRLVALLTIILATILFAASLMAEGIFNFFGNMIFPYLPSFLISVIQLGTSLLSILVSILFFALIFKILPDVRIGWRDLLTGACVTTVLFLIGKYLIGFYLASTSYQAAGTFVIFLIWAYYNVQVMLTGVEFTRTYITYFNKPISPAKNAAFTAS